MKIINKEDIPEFHFYEKDMKMNLGNHVTHEMYRRLDGLNLHKPKKFRYSKNFYNKERLDCRVEENIRVFSEMLKYLKYRYEHISDIYSMELKLSEESDYVQKERKQTVHQSINKKAEIVAVKSIKDELKRKEKYLCDMSYYKQWLDIKKAGGAENYIKSQSYLLLKLVKNTVKKM